MRLIRDEDTNEPRIQSASDGELRNAPPILQDTPSQIPSNDLRGSSDLVRASGNQNIQTIIDDDLVNVPLGPLEVRNQGASNNSRETLGQQEIRTLLGNNNSGERHYEVRTDQEEGVDVEKIELSTPFFYRRFVLKEEVNDPQLLWEELLTYGLPQVEACAIIQNRRGLSPRSVSNDRGE